MSDAGSCKELVPVGKVTKAHSIRGEIKVHPFSGSPETMLRYRELFLAVERAEDSSSAPAAYQVERARVQKNAVLLQLKGCRDRNAAEKLIGLQISVREDALPKLKSDEFYLRDVDGKLVKTEEGRIIGRISGFLTNSSQDVLRVTAANEEYLIPLVPEFLLAVEEDEVTLSLPPGLLEINS